MNWIHNILVGLLFFGALVVVGYFTIVSDSGPFAKPGVQVVVFFDDADGIKTGSRVTVLGVPMGSVVDVRLVPVDSVGMPVTIDSPLRYTSKVAITIELKQKVVFYNNYNIEVKNESLLSGKIIAIDPGSARQANFASQVPTVLSVASETTRNLSNSGKTALQYQEEMFGRGYDTKLQGNNTGDPVAALSEMINANREDVRKTIQNIAEITDKINAGKGSLGLLINDDQLHRNANTLVTDAQVVVKELRESMEDTREQAPVTSFIRAALSAF